MEPMLNIALRAARKGNQILLRALDRPDLVKIYSQVSRNRVVTNLHVQAEKAIIEDLLLAYPDSRILSQVIETESPSDPSDNELIWRIETLSGSLNLIREISHFPIAVSCRRGKKVLHSVIIDPVLNEEFTASRGNGARFNNRRIRVAEEIDLPVAFIAADLPGAPDLRQKMLKKIEILVLESVNLRISGCNLLEMAYLASGRFHAFLASEVDPGEMEAGFLLIQEAGGLITDLSGGTELKSGEILAGSPGMIKKLLKLLH